MRFFIALPLSFFTALLFAQGPDRDSIPTLIKKLGSSNFQDRQAATKALKDRADAAPALRDLSRSPDAEVARRAAEILDFLDVREVHTAVKEGAANRVIELLVAWPKGKHDEDSWAAVRELGRTLDELHQKQGGERIRLVDAGPAYQPEVICEKRIDETTKVPVGLLFFRARAVDVDPMRVNQEVAFDLNCVRAIVAAGSVRTRAVTRPQVIFAGGRVTLEGANAGDVIVVSGGDVTLDGDFASSLFIARGKVTCTAKLGNCRIISGKSVEYNKRAAQNCIITENEPNPLGYIRWADAPKDKAAPKSK